MEETVVLWVKGSTMRGILIGSGPLNRTTPAYVRAKGSSGFLRRGEATFDSEKEFEQFFEKDKPTSVTVSTSESLVHFETETFEFYLAPISGDDKDEMVRTVARLFVRYRDSHTPGARRSLLREIFRYVQAGQGRQGKKDREKGATPEKEKKKKEQYTREEQRRRDENRRRTGRP